MGQSDVHVPNLGFKRPCSSFCFLIGNLLPAREQIWASLLEEERASLPPSLSLPASHALGTEAPDVQARPAEAPNMWVSAAKRSHAWARPQKLPSRAQPKLLYFKN